MSRQILVVEDDNAIAAFVATALEREGYTVNWARTGQEALSHVQGGATCYCLVAQWSTHRLGGSQWHRRGSLYRVGNQS